MKSKKDNPLDWLKTKNQFDVPCHKCKHTYVEWVVHNSYDDEKARKDMMECLMKKGWSFTIDTKATCPRCTGKNRGYDGVESRKKATTDKVSWPVMSQLDPKLFGVKGEKTGDSASAPVRTVNEDVRSGQASILGRLK